MGILWIVTLLACQAGPALACSSTNECTSECYNKLTQKGCQGMLQTLAQVLQDQNITQYCSLAQVFRNCVDTTFAECDQNLDKSTFTGGMDETYASLCQGSPVDTCRMHMAVCSQYLPQSPDSGMPGCGPMKQYLDCVKEKMKMCDPSVSMTSVVGPMQASFDMQCSAAGGGFCPGVGQCMQSLFGSASNQGEEGAAAPDIIKQCDVMGEALECLHTEQTKCNATMKRSYSFHQVAALYDKGCALMSSNSDVFKCDQVIKCLQTFDVLSDPDKLTSLTSDPQFWCSMMKNVMECSSKSPKCKSDPSDFESFQEEVHKVCPEAKIMVTTEGSGSVFYPGVLAVLVASLAALLFAL